LPRLRISHRSTQCPRKRLSQRWPHFNMNNVVLDSLCHFPWTRRWSSVSCRNGDMHIRRPIKWHKGLDGWSEDSQL
jgi:hypothetical protein